MNKYKKQKISIGNLASGENIYITSYTFTGVKEGPKVYIQANLHGPEIVGVLVIQALIKQLKAQKSIFGQITLVPSVNPIALNMKIGGSNVGYSNMRSQNTPANWNEIFKDFTHKHFFQKLFLYTKVPVNEAIKKFEREYKKILVSQLDEAKKSYASIEDIFALTLQNLSFGHDYFLDLHSAQNNIEHVYCSSHAKEKAKLLGIPYIVELSGDSLACFDEACVRPYLHLYSHLEYKSSQLNKFSFTVEFQGTSFDIEYVQKSVEKIWNFLCGIGLVSTKTSSQEKQKFTYISEKQIKSYFSPTSGIVVANKKPGDPFKKGETLAYIHEIEGKVAPLIAQTDGIVYFYPLYQSIFSGEEVVGVFAK